MSSQVNGTWTRVTIISTPCWTPSSGLAWEYRRLSLVLSSITHNLSHDEHRAGLEEGRKDRPSVIVLSITRESDDATIVTVLPITHAAPDDPKAAIEIPLPVKKHLGLDDARSWIVTAEGNEFVWPGYDLRKAPKTDSYEFGFLPPRLFNQVRDGFVAFHKAGQTKTTSRT